MLSTKKLIEIVFEIYRRQYVIAKPNADFDKLHKSGVTKKENWFMHYYLSIEEQTKILDAVCKQFKCRGKDKQRVSANVFLGAAPNSSEETWKKYTKHP